MLRSLENLQFIKNNPKGTLSQKKPDRIYERCLDGKVEAHLIALTYIGAEQGHAGWTLRLLRDQRWSNWPMWKASRMKRFELC